MFSNIGRKIKVTAKVFCWIGIICSVISGIGMIVSSVAASRYASFEYILLMIGAGVAVIVLGSLLSWVGSFMMVGFGELIEKTTEIAENTRRTY